MSFKKKFNHSEKNPYYTKKTHNYPKKKPDPNNFKKPNPNYKTSKNILKGVNFVELKNVIEREEDIQKPQDLARIRQKSSVWFSLREDESGLRCFIKNSILKFGKNDKVIFASRLPNWLCLFGKYCSKQFGNKYPKDNAEFQNMLLGKTPDRDERFNINTGYGTSHEDTVVRGFEQIFKDEKTNVEIRETGYHILRSSLGIQLWCSPDGEFKIECEGYEPIIGSFEAKTISPFIFIEKTKSFFFNMHMKTPEHIKFYNVPQFVTEIYSTNSPCGTITYYTTHKGIVCFLKKADKNSSSGKAQGDDKLLLDLMFACLAWAMEYYKDYKGGEIKGNPYENCIYYKKLIEMIVIYANKFDAKFFLSTKEFEKGLKFDDVRTFLFK